MTTEAIEYLRELVDMTSVSGAEEDMVRSIVRLVRPLADSVDVDPFGNVIAIRKAEGPEARTCLFAAHMDEVGFRIRAVDDNGFLRFEKVGGTDNRVLLGQRVWIRTEQGRMLGVIGTKSAHFLKPDERKTVPEHSDLYIDIGARSADEVRRMGVRIGTPAGFTGELAELGTDSGRYTAHALDDRVGCAVLLALLDNLRDRAVPITVIAIFTVQEEVGLRGAQAATQGQKADLGIAIDTTALDDTPDIGTGQLRLGAGPGLKVMDFSLLPHPALQRGLTAAGERSGVPLQPEILMGIGTDAGALQFGGAGIPAGTLSVGTRYTHSPVEVLDKQDLDDAVQVLEQFVLLVPDLDLRFTSLE